MPMIEVEKLQKHYTVAEKEAGLKGSLKSFFSRKTKTVKAVDGVSFSLEGGEMVGFLGANGAGKTTTLKMLSPHRCCACRQSQPRATSPSANRSRSAGRSAGRRVARG